MRKMLLIERIRATWLTLTSSSGHAADVVDPMPPTFPVLVDRSDRYSRATDSVRTTAKWLLATLAAVGAALIAGIQLTKLGSLQLAQWPRIVAAAVSLAAALTAVGYMIHHTARVFTDEWITLAELSNEQLDLELDQIKVSSERKSLLEDIRTRVERNRQELFGSVADSIPALHRALRQSNVESRKLADSETAPSAHAVWAAAWAHTVRNTAMVVTDYANYYRTLTLLKKIKRRLAIAGAVAAVAVAIFAYATNPEAPKAPTKVEIVRSTP
jgi:hypothetical protein